MNRYVPNIYGRLGPVIEGLRYQIRDEILILKSLDQLLGLKVPLTVDDMHYLLMRISMWDSRQYMGKMGPVKYLFRFQNPSACKPVHEHFY